MRFVRLPILILAALSLSACGVFGGKKDVDELPLELLPIETTVKLRREWSTRLGDDAENLRVALRPSSDGTRLYAASIDGNVHAMIRQAARNSGPRSWILTCLPGRHSLKNRI